ncbi:hypothetical protein ISCGN_024110 [Ixodes scapularis]
MKVRIFCITFFGTILASSLAQGSGAPKVHSTGFPPDLTIGDETGAHCVVRKDGSAPVSILWHKDGVALEPNDRITVTMVSMSSSTLAITRIELGDVGNYTCTATSVQGSSEVTVKVAPKLQEFFFPSHIALGKKAQVYCAVYEGNGPFSFSWKKDGLSLDPAPGSAIRQVTESTSLLILDAVAVGDIGNYTCVVSSGAGSDSYTASLHVKGLLTVAVITPSSAQSSDAPKVHSAGFPPDLTLGDETAVHCVVKKAVTGPVLLSWRKDGADVQSNDRLTVSRPTASSSMISIRRIEPEDVGNYTCTASSVQGSSEVMVPLVVIGPLKVHSFGFPPDLRLGGETGAFCVLTKEAPGPVSISWFKDGVKLDSGGRVTVVVQTSSSTLTIKRIEPGDIGNYTCVADSAEGSGEVTVPLTVLGKLLSKSSTTQE